MLLSFLSRQTLHRSRVVLSKLAPVPVSVPLQSYSRNVYCSTSTEKKNLTKKEQILVKSAMTGTPTEFLKRKVQIVLDVGRSNQSATGRRRTWRIQMNYSSQWNSELMGWTSGSDPLRTAVKLKFGTKEEAIQYVTRLGFEYEVLEPTIHDNYGERTYADNFKYIPPAPKDKE